MKLSIRQGVFETNSSSVHTICISKNPDLTIVKKIDFYLGEYGWEFGEANKYNYLYTAIMISDKREEYLGKLKAILEKYKVKYTFEQPKYGSWISNVTGEKHYYLDNGHIDHDYELKDFLEGIFEEEDFLLRYLFNDDSTVYTGNDNSDGFWRYKTAYQGFPEGYDDNDNRVKNPYHDETKFDYYVKGN